MIKENCFLLSMKTMVLTYTHKPVLHRNNLTSRGNKLNLLQETSACDASLIQKVTIKAFETQKPDKACKKSEPLQGFLVSKPCKACRRLLKQTFLVPLCQQLWFEISNAKASLANGCRGAMTTSLLFVGFGGCIQARVNVFLQKPDHSCQLLRHKLDHQV